jgi:hypothetical protein
MGFTPESIDKLKKDYELKLSKLPKPAQTAAKKAWDKLIDVAIVALTAKLTSMKSLKLMDKISLGVAAGAASKLKGVVAGYKAQVQTPMKKVLKGSNALETKELNKTLDSVGSNENDSANVATNNAGRAAASVASVENGIKDLDSNIVSLNKLKFNA